MTKLPEKRKKVEYNSDNESWGNAGDSYDHGYEVGQAEGANAMHAQWTALIEDGTLCVVPERNKLADFLKSQLYWDLGSGELADAIILLLKSQSIKEKGE